MRPVNVGISHDDDFVVTQFFQVERTVAFTIADPCADRGNHRANFVVVQDLIQPGFLHVDQFAANRENGLKFPVAPLLGRSAGRITFDDEQFRVSRVAV